MFDGEAFGQQMVEIVRGYVAAELEPLIAANKALEVSNAALAERIAALETRELVLPEKGDPGEVDMDAVREIIAAAVAAEVAALPPPKDGESVDMDEVERMVASAVAALPAPRDGTDCDMDAVMRRLAEEVAVAVSTLPPAEKGEPGADANMEEIGLRIEATVKSAVDALPAPKDGQAGKDGLGLANALIDRDGGLVVTFTDGSSKNLGMVVGKDGRDGQDGHTFTLDDFDIEPLDERTIKMGFTYGEVKHSFELSIPALIYRNVWREGETYQRGDMVTWGGSLWHCDKDGCTSKPDGGDFTLAVKRGRDGRDAK